mgnify:CR=1 FL=1
MTYKHIKLGIKIHSAGEWILDNFYIIEEIVKTVRKEMPLKKYCKMIGLASGKYEGFARSYVFIKIIISLKIIYKYSFVLFLIFNNSFNNRFNSKSLKL